MVDTILLHSFLLYIGLHSPSSHTSHQYISIDVECITMQICYFKIVYNLHKMNWTVKLSSAVFKRNTHLCGPTHFYHISNRHSGNMVLCNATLLGDEMHFLLLTFGLQDAFILITKWFDDESDRDGLMRYKSAKIVAYWDWCSSTLSLPDFWLLYQMKFAWSCDLPEILYNSIVGLQEPLSE